MCSSLFQSILLIGCNEKFSLDELSGVRSIIVSSDTSYDEIVPPFEGFNEPHAILIGNDYLLYVADTKNNRIVMMNTAGLELSRLTILQPISIAQDLRLDLLVGGVVIMANGDTVGAIFRIHLVNAQHNLAEAKLDTIWKEVARPNRQFVGIGVFHDNSYLVVRSGPDNSSFVDPDSRILKFSADNVFITPVADVVTRRGSGITDINRPTGIAVFPDTSRDFILLQTNEGVAYGAIWMIYQKTTDFDGWLPKFDPVKPEQRFIDFIRPNRFINPSGVVIDGKRRDIFIADVAQDSIFKFDSRGKFKAGIVWL